MALEHLLDELNRRAEGEADALRERGRAEAAAIAAAAEQRTLERRRAALGAREQELRDAAERAVSVARRDARRLELEARGRLIDRVLSAAATRLPAAARTGAFRAALPGRLAEGLACLGDLPATLRCTPGLEDVARATVGGRPGLAVSGDPTVGAGFRIESTDGRLVIDGTLGGQLERERAALALVVLRAMVATQ